MAAPHVAAVAALILEQGDYSPDEVFSIMAQTTNDVGQAGYDTETGYGLLNAYEAVALAAGSSTETTSPSTETDQSSDEVDTTQPTDTTAPTIYDAGASVDDTAFTIYWSTDEESSSYVYFEGFGRYGDDEMTTSHSLSFTGQLDVTYTVELQSTDAAGNTGTDGPYELTL